MTIHSSVILLSWKSTTLGGIAHNKYAREEEKRDVQHHHARHHQRLAGASTGKAAAANVSIALANLSSIFCCGAGAALATYKLDMTRGSASAAWEGMGR